MATFSLYRFDPGLLRSNLSYKLSWSLKHILDAWPHDICFPQEAQLFFSRLHQGQVDACDFVLHHQLLQNFINSDFDLAQDIIKYGSKREPLSNHLVRSFSPACLGADFKWYSSIYKYNDLLPGSLDFIKPCCGDYDRSHAWVQEAFQLLSSSVPLAFAELNTFKTLWILASPTRESSLTFGGHSSCLAWGAVLINSQFKSFADILIQIIHELAHQLLFALAVDVPLALNSPGELYRSPLRKDSRPMDGVIHACFVSARLYEVLGLIQCSDAFMALSEADKHIICTQQLSSKQAVINSVPIIKEYGKLSALGERILAACVKTIQS